MGWMHKVEGTMCIQCTTLHSTRWWLCSIHCMVFNSCRLWLFSIYCTGFHSCNCSHVPYSAWHFTQTQWLFCYAVHTFLISNGYLVIRCIGLMRKLLRGMPLMRGSLWHCFTMLRNSGDSFVTCWRNVAALSCLLQKRIYAVMHGSCIKQEKKTCKTLCLCWHCLTWQGFAEIYSKNPM